MPDFVPARELSAAFYQEVVAPQLCGVTHSAALLGYGSDVLGYDTPRSTDHGWGPRVLVFTEDGSLPPLVFPELFRGWPVAYGWDAVKPQHHVTGHVLGDWLLERLGVDATAELTPADWLTMPWQRLLEVVSGAVHHDGLDILRPLRARLAWYPEDLHRYVVASQWHRLAQEEPFVGRTREVGDEDGARLVEGRLRRDLMRLALLLHRRWPPYSKWLGTAFSELEVELPSGPTAFSVIAELHNASGLTAPLDPSLRDFYTRPYPVLGCDRFADATRETITDARLRALPLFGSVDQVCDSVDVLNEHGLLFALRELYADVS